MFSYKATSQEIFYGKPMTWTPRREMTLADIEKGESLDPEHSVSLDGKIVYEGKTAYVFNDDYGQQEYMFVDLPSADKDGYGLGNIDWEDNAAFILSRLV